MEHCKMQKPVTGEAQSAPWRIDLGFGESRGTFPPGYQSYRYKGILIACGPGGVSIKTEEHPQAGIAYAVIGNYDGDTGRICAR